MTSCDNCGSRLYGGICSNCHEELYIVTNQSDDINFALSDEFLQKAEQQQREVTRKRRMEQEGITEEDIEETRSPLYYPENR